MNIDITDLENNSKNILEINEDFIIEDEKLKNTDIQKVKKLNIKGNITKIDHNLYNFNININGLVVLVCARSLEEIDYPLNINVDQTVEINEKNKQNLINILDIFDIVWENILLEVPSRIIKEDANYKTSGEGWSLKSENDTTNQFEELKSLLDMEERKE